MAGPAYQPRNILLTGGAGFIGSHVVARLLLRSPSYRVVVLDKLDYCASLRNLDVVAHLPNLKFVKGDITSTDFVLHLLNEEAIDTILNFAAQTHVDNSFGNSFSFTQNNVLGTHTLLESARLCGTIKRFIHVSTDEVYGEASHGSGMASGEQATLEPTNPYSATKAAAEMLVKAYYTSYRLPCIITRGNNVYGPHQYPEKLIPKFILLARIGAKLPIHGSGASLRSFLHVNDVADAFDVIVHKGVPGETYNIGTNEERSVLEVAKDICVHMALDPDSKIEYVSDRLFNDRRYFIDESKLRALGWSQRMSWQEGLKMTISWYLNYVTDGSYWLGYERALTAHPMPALPVVPMPEPPAYQLATTKAAGGSPPLVFLVYGRNGWIGGLLGDLLTQQGAQWSYGIARLEDRGGILADIRKVKPTHVLNAAGVTGRPNVDWCESNRNETIRTNVIGVLNLVDICRTGDIHVTNFATGCIYSYDDSHFVGSGNGFTETDPPNFVGSYYSHTKAMVESLLREYRNVLQLRLRMPISKDLGNTRNFVYKIVNYDKVVDIPNSMSVLDELLPVSLHMARQSLTGVYNFTNPGVISHNEVLQLYKEYVDPVYSWTNFTEEEQSKILAAPRSNNELDASKLLCAVPGLLNIKESLIKFVFEPARAAGLDPCAVRCRKL